MKKTYTKPEAELFSFYSDEEITSVQSLNDLSSELRAVFLLDDNEENWI